MGMIGSCIKKLGTDDKGRVLCLPIALAEILFGCYSGVQAGWMLYNTVNYYQSPNINWEDAWTYINLIITAFLCLTYVMGSLSMLFMGLFNTSKGSSWAIKLTMFMAITALISYVFTIIQYTIDYWANEEVDFPQELEQPLIIQSVLLVLQFILVKFMLDAHMSAKAVIRAGGSLWGGKNAEHYRHS